MTAGAAIPPIALPLLLLFCWEEEEEDVDEEDEAVEPLFVLPLPLEEEEEESEEGEAFDGEAGLLFEEVLEPAAPWFVPVAALDAAGFAAAGFTVAAAVAAAVAACVPAAACVPWEPLLLPCPDWFWPVLPALPVAPWEDDDAVEGEGDCAPGLAPLGLFWLDWEAWDEEEDCAPGLAPLGLFWLDWEAWEEDLALEEDWLLEAELPAALPMVI